MVSPGEKAYSISLITMVSSLVTAVLFAAFLTIFPYVNPLYGKLQIMSTLSPIRSCGLHIQRGGKIFHLNVDIEFEQSIVYDI